MTASTLLIGPALADNSKTDEHDNSQNSAKTHVNPPTATTSANALTAICPPTATPFALFCTSLGAVLLMVVAETTLVLLLLLPGLGGFVWPREVVSTSLTSKVSAENSRVSGTSEVADVGSRD